MSISPVAPHPSPNTHPLPGQEGSKHLEPSPNRTCDTPSPSRRPVFTLAQLKSMGAFVGVLVVEPMNFTIEGVATRLGKREPASRATIIELLRKSPHSFAYRSLSRVGPLLGVPYWLNGRKDTESVVKATLGVTGLTLMVANGFDNLKGSLQVKKGLTPSDVRQLWGGLGQLSVGGYGTAFVRNSGLYVAVLSGKSLAQKWFPGTPDESVATKETRQTMVAAGVAGMAGALTAIPQQAKFTWMRGIVEGNRISMIDAWRGVLRDPRALAILAGGRAVGAVCTSLGMRAGEAVVEKYASK